MAQDIRELLKDRGSKSLELSKGHENRFEAKLNEVFPEEKSNFSWMKVAVIAIVLISVTFFGYQYLSDFNGTSIDKNSNPIVTTDENDKEKANQISIGDLSPDLKKVEDYYLAGINMQLATLIPIAIGIDADNKDLIDGYMNQLSVLDKEYKKLNLELNKVGPSEATITALIDNLKLRLDLLFKLKNKLNEYKTQENEQINNI